MMRLIGLLSLLLSFIAAVPSFAADSIKDAFAKGSLTGDIRLYYFERDYDQKTKTKSDSDIATILYYKTDSFHGLSAGVALASVHDAFTDRDDDGYPMMLNHPAPPLKKTADHEGFSRLQEYYIQGDYFNTTIKYGGQKIATPFMNPHDIRMLPKSYEGLSIVNNSIKDLTLSAYYITGFMGFYGDTVTMVESFSPNASNDDRDKNVIVLGAKYNLPIDSAKVSVQGWHYNMEDVFYSYYALANVSKQVGDYNVYFTPSALVQKPQGDKLATELQKETDQYGFNIGAKAYGFDVTGYYAKTGKNDIFAPWGDGKVIIQQVEASGRAKEDAYGAKIAYDFSDLGIKGLSAYAFYTKYDTPESGKYKSPDMSETDFEVQYKLSGALDGFSVRVRYAMTDKKGAEDYNDFRLYLRYNFAMLGK